MSGNNYKILAGIVTYNPSIDRFKECLDAIHSQVKDVYIFDNGSENINEIECLIEKYCDSLILYRNKKNAGIATALARIMEYADRNSYDWVLSMDQDSLLQKGIIDAYRNSIKMPSNVGMFTCLIKDRNFEDSKYEKQSKAEIDVKYCITSGALTSVDAYKKTSGYDEDFFIDCVDFDICYSLREVGFRIIRVNHFGLLHEVGQGENRRFLWKKIVVYHEKPKRIYYLARNTKRLYKKHRSYGLLRLIKKEAALLLRIIVYEDNKKEKLSAFCKGILLDS
ncbi:MAG: glycosyltransferase [Blautia sp.]|nr:glycosyltransferase [Blautia sp.]